MRQISQLPGKFGLVRLAKTFVGKNHRHRSGGCSAAGGTNAFGRSSADSGTGSIALPEDLPILRRSMVK
jgi:hypothetical protein